MAVHLGILSNGSSKICLPACWWVGTACVPNNANIAWNASGDRAILYVDGVKINGSATCGANDATWTPYLASGGLLSVDSCGTSRVSNTFALNIWQAWVDGLWSSSVAIELWAIQSVAGSGWFTAEGRNSNCTPACKNYSFEVSAGPCPTVPVATATYYDDGTFTVA